MLTVHDRRPDRNCQGYTRRDFLRVGSLGVGGLTLSSLLAARAALASRPGVVRNKSVVLLFLQGGPPQTETFDPKMTAPSNVRSQTGEVPTVIPGITFGGTFPRMARIADRLAVVRSFSSRNSGHTYLSVAGGGNPLRASMGSIYARIAGRNHPLTGMPSNTIVLPEAVRDGLELKRNFETQALPTLTTAGELDSTYAAFNPSGGGQLKQDLELRIPVERLDDRRSLLERLDTLRRGHERSPTFAESDRYRQQAFDVITRGLAEAFDLSSEDPRTIERYDTSKLFRMEEWTKHHNMKRTSNLLGLQMLLARRLCEAGCGFVTVSDCGWDLHADGNSARGMTAMEPLGGQVDHAVAAFVDDVRQRGLSDDILLIVTGEMGRTPKINNRGGRDHWGNLTPLVLAGGGLEMGQVIGRSDSQAAEPASERVTPENLFATVMHTLFDIGQLRLEPDLPPELLQFVGDAEPIRGLA